MRGERADPGRILARAAEELQRHFEGELAPGLYVVSTPIGNLGDITLRAIAVLARADAVLCEDTRHSRTLLSHFGIGTPARPYHEHNAAKERPRVLADLAAGHRIALISDAGTPLVSDPGWKLVREAIDAGHRVEALPGASASLTALAVAGLPTDAFLFAGFLPPKSAGRRTRIAELAAVPATLVFFEAPSRVAETLADLAVVLGPRPAALARELTKLHEEVRRAPLDRLAADLDGSNAEGRGGDPRRPAAAGRGERRRHRHASGGGAGADELARCRQGRRRRARRPQEPRLRSRPAPAERRAMTADERRARLRRGRLAETLAAAALIAKGYRILGRNVKTRAGEIDIVAVRGRRLAFVEVKRRLSGEDVEAAVSARQAARIRVAADYWLARRPRYHQHEQGFDLVLLLPHRWPRHIPNGL